MARFKKQKAGERVIFLNQTEHKGELKPIGGSMSDDFNHILVNQAANTLWRSQNDEKYEQQQVNAVAATMLGASPRDEIEGMLAAQMIGAHNAAMECFRRAMLPNQPFEGRRENLNLATKLVRSYTSLIEALDRHRGKGQQHVTVEHVHVNEGGQAIVGAVNGRRTRTKAVNSEEVTGAAISHQPAEPMRCADPEREALPVAASAGGGAL